MNKRFTYLVSKYLDKGLTDAEKVEFEKFLDDPLCVDYLKKAEIAEKIIEEGFRKRIADAEKKIVPHTDVGALQKEIEGGEFQEEIEADISRYGSDLSAHTHKAVSQMHRNMNDGRKRTVLLRYAGIAAAILFTFILFRALYPKPTPQMLFEEYYKTYDFLIIRSSIHEDEIYSNAIVNYMEGNYDKSSKLCRESLASQVPDPKIHFLYGLNLIQLDSLQKAIQQFNNTSSFPLEKDSNLNLSVYWYESLCYLAMSQPDSALLSLDMIKDVEKGRVQGIDVEGVIEGINRLKGE